MPRQPDRYITKSMSSTTPPNSNDIAMSAWHFSTWFLGSPRRHARWTVHSTMTAFSWTLPYDSIVDSAMCPFCDMQRGGPLQHLTSQEPMRTCHQRWKQKLYTCVATSLIPETTRRSRAVMQLSPLGSACDAIRPPLMTYLRPFWPLKTSSPSGANSEVWLSLLQYIVKWVFSSNL